MEPFKNACLIADRLLEAHPAFPIKDFRRGLEKVLEPLELKDRMRLLADRHRSRAAVDRPSHLAW